MKTVKELVIEHTDMIKNMVKASEIKFLEPHESFSPTTIVQPVYVSDQLIEIGVDVADCVDVEKEFQKIDKERAKKQKELIVLKNKINNDDFVKRAPSEIVEKVRNSIRNIEDFLDSLTCSEEKLKLSL